MAESVVSRRSLLKTAGVGISGLAVGAVADELISPDSEPSASAPPERPVPDPRRVEGVDRFIRLLRDGVPNPPNRLFEGKSAVPTQTWSFRQQQAAPFGLTLADPNEIAAAWSHTTDLQERFEILRRFSLENFGIDMVWEVPDKFSYENLIDVAKGLVEMCHTPLEVYRAVQSRSGQTPVFRFTDVESGLCRPEAGGCAFGSDLRIILPKAPSDDDNGSIVRRAGFGGTMFHEWMHYASPFVSPGLDELVKAARPAYFVEWTADEFFAKQQVANQQKVPLVNEYPGDVASTYGRVDTEAVTTLAEHLPYADVLSFENSESLRLDPENASASVVGFAALVASIDQSLGRDCDYVGYIADTFVGSTVTSAAADNSLPRAVDVVSYHFVNELQTERVVNERVYALNGNRRLKFEIMRPGPLSERPGETTLNINSDGQQSVLQVLSTTAQELPTFKSVKLSIDNEQTVSIVRAKPYGSDEQWTLKVELDGRDGLIVSALDNATLAPARRARPTSLGLGD